MSQASNNTLEEYYLHLDPRQWLSWEIVLKIEWYKDLVVWPIIGVTGISGNIFSGIIIMRSGLGKPSNIFLLGLAVVDNCCLLLLLDVPALITYLPSPFPQDERGWEMSYTGAYVCHVLTHTIQFISGYGCRMSTTLTVIITLERLVAVFLPMKFAQLVTCSRAWLVMISATIFWFPVHVFMRFWYSFTYSYDKRYNTYQGNWGRSYLWKNGVVDLDYFYNVPLIQLSHSIPLIIVTAGCILIGVKVSINLRQRRKLTSSTSEKTRSASRTTRTLFMVCLAYSITRMSWAFYLLPQLDEDSPVMSNANHVYNMSSQTLLYLNSSVNFFIYIAFNGKFRKIIKDMLTSSRK